MFVAPAVRELCLLGTEEENTHHVVWVRYYSLLEDLVGALQSCAYCTHGPRALLFLFGVVVAVNAVIVVTSVRMRGEHGGRDMNNKEYGIFG